jgi:hypothetical protein
MSASVTTDPTRRRVLTGVGLGVGLFVVGLCWALASPIGASPDDDFHLGTIWCSETAPDDQCVDTGNRPFPNQIEVLVPRAIAQNWVDCYYGDPTEAASCQPPEDEWAIPTVSRADDHSYPGGYHALFGFLVTDRPELSVLGMRVLAWTLSIGLMASAVLIASGPLRRAFTLAAVLGSIPLGIFLFASNNPSGMTIAGVFSFGCGALAAFDLDPGRRRRAALGIAAVGVVFALMSRRDGAVWIAAASVVVCALSWQRLRRDPKLLVLPVVALFASLVAIGVSGAVDVAREGLEPPELDRRTSELAFENIVGLPLLWTGPAGTWGLGWGEIAMPPLVSATMVGVVGAAIVRGLAFTWREKWVALGVAAASVSIVPFAVLMAGEEFVGEAVQPRYLLPMLLVLLGVAVLQRRDSSIDLFNRPQRILLAVAVPVAHSAALQVTIRRFVTGTDVRELDLDQATEWWWASGPSPRMIWIVGSVVFAAVAGYLLLTSARTPRRGGREVVDPAA